MPVFDCAPGNAPASPGTLAGTEQFRIIINFAATTGLTINSTQFTTGDVRLQRTGLTSLAPASAIPSPAAGAAPYSNVNNYNVTYQVCRGRRHRGSLMERLGSSQPRVVVGSGLTWEAGTVRPFGRSMPQPAACWLAGLVRI
jgi:hypothetical protein